MRSYIRRPHSSASGYSARDVAKAYNCPVDHADGTGVTIGVIELGGAYNSRDLVAMGLNSGNVIVVNVVGGKPKSDGANGADGEVMLDVEVIAEVAPGAAIRVYFCPNTDAGFLAGIKQAADECDVVSISWGGPESSWSKSSIQAYAAAFADAKSRGVNVFVASGDSGSKDGTRSNVVDYPASDPSVIGCGGTRLVMTGSQRTSEVTWDDNDTQSATGGGVSKVFPGRTVPDVAGNADPQTGYSVVVDGEQAVIGGTSAVAPLYAAMTAILLDLLGHSFDFNGTVGANPTICYDVTAGDNGGFRAGPGRDNVTGWGVVDMGLLLGVLGGGVVTPTPVPTPDPAGDPLVFLAKLEGEIAAYRQAHG